MYCKNFWFKYFATLLKTVQIKAKGKDAYQSSDHIARIDFLSPFEYQSSS